MIQLSEIKENIYSIKGIGYNDLNFHGTVFQNDEGASYNAYLIVDEEITLIDTIDAEFTDEFLKTIKRVIGDRPIDNIIINHVEPDHSYSLGEVKKLYPKAECYCSDKAEKPLQNMFFGEHEYKTVKNLEKLNIGKYNLMFILMPFIHWPDNMATFLEEEKILFSNDAFGSLVTSNNLYDDQYELATLLKFSKEYYANIVMPCSKFVLKKLDEIVSLDLGIKLICPAHGIIWRSNINEIIEKYYEWASFINDKNKVVIIYDTIWGNTELLTNELASKLAESDLEVRVFKAGKHRPSLIMTEVLDASAVIIGTSNFNSTMLPTIADILERLYALKPQNKIGAAYGSYGWAKTHVNRVKDRLVEANFELLDADALSNYTPDHNEISNIGDFAQCIAEKVKNK